ncbi:MAG: LysR family transcriptional regulator [Gammaproteobacteria bacterium]|nr:LysR family transcriptional regulator [Gammaproteobacteria bacterium]
MKNITFRQLQVFESIARNHSFTLAAEELFLTQPTVSMQIRKLADTIGMPLFEQIGKRIYLTDAGQELLTASRDISDTFSSFDMKIANMKGIKQGNLRLSSVTTAEYLAPRILGIFCQQYPGIKVFLEITNRERVLQRIEDNKDDLYIVSLPPNNLNLNITPFLDNPLVVLAPANHPLATKKNISIEELSKENFVMREPGAGTGVALAKLKQNTGAEFNVIMELGSNEAIKQAVIGGLGLSILSKYALSHELQAGVLVLLDVQYFPLEYSWYIVYPKGKQLSLVAQRFYEFLLKEGIQLIGL